MLTSVLGLRAPLLRRSGASGSAGAAAATTLRSRAPAAAAAVVVRSSGSSSALSASSSSRLSSGHATVAYTRRSTLSPLARGGSSNRAVVVRAAAGDAERLPAITVRCGMPWQQVEERIDAVLNPAGSQLEQRRNWVAKFVMSAGNLKNPKVQSPPAKHVGHYRTRWSRAGDCDAGRVVGWCCLLDQTDRRLLQYTLVVPSAHSSSCTHTHTHTQHTHTRPAPTNQ